MIKKPEKQGVYLKKISHAQAKNRLIYHLLINTPSNLHTPLKVKHKNILNQLFCFLGK